MRADALLKKLAETLAKVVSKTLPNTLSDVDSKALLDMVADTVALSGNEKYGKTLVDVTDTRAQLEAKTVSDRH